MAENNSDDAQEKTEEPTQRRIDKAKGGRSDFDL